MKYLVLVLLLTGCVYTHSQIHSAVNRCFEETVRLYNDTCSGGRMCDGTPTTAIIAVTGPHKSADQKQR